MNQKLEEMDANPDKTRAARRWTAFEFTERCPDSRSGTQEVDLYVNQEKMDVIGVEAYNKKEKNKQKDYLHHKA
ncbi:hypothetical protein, partial [Staphylococcus aureus]|uniref:hypothetical protein n=1 Tax=Staphylococcus aureus TaxID=1280 RepID=UPI0028977886